LVCGSATDARTEFQKRLLELGRSENPIVILSGVEVGFASATEPKDLSLFPDLNGAARE
jgi:hypothetical protein